MQYKIDWFSFTFPIGLLGENDNEHSLQSILLCFHDHTSHRFLGVVTNALWAWVQSAGFYNHRIQCPRTGCTISWKGDSPYALFEASGQACEKLFASLTPGDLARSSNGRATRIDFAVDIETSVPPTNFAADRKGGRIQSVGDFISPTGHTVYIGSRKGDRMARVYRYFEPHPRAHLLRVEAEYKGDAAKRVCEALIQDELKNVVLSAHLPFGWTHPVWTPESAEISKIPARAYDRQGAGTLMWLRESVLPAIRNCREKGLIVMDDELFDRMKRAFLTEGD